MSRIITSQVNLVNSNGKEKPKTSNVRALLEDIYKNLKITPEITSKVINAIQEKKVEEFKNGNLISPKQIVEQITKNDLDNYKAIIDPIIKGTGKESERARLQDLSKKMF